MVLTLYFEIATEAEIAYDLDTKDFCPARMKIILPAVEELSEELIEIYRSKIADNLGVGLQHIKALTAEEYKSLKDNRGEK